MMDSSLTQYALQIVIIALPLLLALTFHEVAHGMVAYRLGDPTAKLHGRLTLNPLKHLDPLGTLIFFIARVGWAKPVPVNPGYFKNPRKGMLLVALAGPLANFALALGFAALFHIFASIDVPGRESLLFKVLYPTVLICQAGVFVNLILGIFNLLPIPPLDGSNILAGILPRAVAAKYMSLARYGVFLILGLVVLGHLFNVSILGSVLLPPVTAAGKLLGVPLY
ncbi:Zn-dependent protease (includes SpoIVFB) [Paucidesulfovibrio gracilis DSM 16080]|uniref:Zn-dependent protease (Includes SpoIVFB) n=1 Tax=Paucidesulfovibrio gracilis DSM 16080 TaxID=1121449 RepID=A0A1T4XGZ0_9BACT|nr:site-2 protease family protein [Paucidesulfovibrio gracilis]SKA88375.1 Zn-dependent protease (includes SpoIVFB) [Paucidesulfovibrio gracilis DSM 16080]